MDTIEQADISVVRDGSIILVVTPIILAADPDHQCFFRLFRKSWQKAL
ncbi:MAG: hypothetical protein HOI35_17695 [Woeseia sp.]|nr:hypothetical protein [Woeseia sp.]